MTISIHPGPDTVRADGTIATGTLPKAATRNACKLCSPLGAAMVFKGIRGCLPFLHGSQGCATYIRRYMISHFREPVDIASSSFSEEDAIFGGARNFTDGVDNVAKQYRPELIGVATTCLSETIGENMIGMIRAYQSRADAPGADVPMVHVSTPAYTGTHSDGYAAAVRAVVEQFALPMQGCLTRRINILPPMVSCADLRHLRSLCGLYGLSATMLPDYSATLEGESWADYNRMSPGGTGIEEIAEMGAAKATLEIGHSLASRKDTAAAFLERTSDVERVSLGWPMGLRLSDLFFATLSRLSGVTMPASLEAERGRLVDAYVDGHKYVSGQRAVIFGEPDLVVGLASFLSEIGIRPVLCATGSRLRGWSDLVASVVEGGSEDIECLDGADHGRISARARELKPDLVFGSSKGYPLSRELKIPLIRIGFPIHDRFGAQRQLTVGYRGANALFDAIVNAVLERKQEISETGYSYV